MNLLFIINNINIIKISIIISVTAIIRILTFLKLINNFLKN